MKNFIVITIFTALAFESAFAKIVWNLEVDPLDYAVGGFALDVGASWRGGRATLGLKQTTVPSYNLDNPDNLDVNYQSISFKLDTKPVNMPGVFFGATIEAADFAVTSEDGLKNSALAGYLGARAGYRVLFDALTFSAVLRADTKVTENDEVSVDTFTFELPQVKYFPAIFIGYNF